MYNSKIKPWSIAIKSDLLWFSAIPVIIGTVMAFGDGIEHLATACVVFFGALITHSGINLINSYSVIVDGREVTFKPIKPKAVKTAIIIVFLLATSAYAYLIDRAGWPMAVLIILSILSGIFYTAGQYSLKRLGLGDILAFIFFGPVAVAGTYYAQSLEINTAVVLAGIAPGLFSVGSVAVKNIHNLEKDRQAGKRTFAVRFGRSFVEMEYFLVIICACLVPILIHAITDDYTLSMAATLTLFFAFKSIKTVLTKSDDLSLENARISTLNLLFLYTILFSVGWISHIFVP